MFCAKRVNGSATDAGGDAMLDQRSLLGVSLMVLVAGMGAFDAVLAKNPDVRFLINHDGVPLARTKNGTITLSVDDHGLRQESQVVDTQLGRDTYAMIKRGDIDQMSFAFTVEREEWNEGTQTRTILQVRDLYDIAAVTYPAYEGASIVARSKSPQGAPAPTPPETTNGPGATSASRVCTDFSMSIAGTPTT